MAFTPLHDRVLVRRVESDEKTKGGLIIPDSAKEKPAEGEVVVKVHTCGLNFGDLLAIKGTYQERPELPFTLGMEVAGVVESTGSRWISAMASTSRQTACCRMFTGRAARWDIFPRTPWARSCRCNFTIKLCGIYPICRSNLVAASLPLC